MALPEKSDVELGAGGYIVDALDLLVVSESDPSPTRYRRWY